MESSYWITALYLEEFQQINVLPPPLKRRCTIYNIYQSLVKSSVENHAVFLKFTFLLSVGIALCDVVSRVQEKILGEHHTSVFFPKDLRRLHQDRLKYLDADEDQIKSFNAARLKEQLLGKTPGIQVQKIEKFVILTVNKMLVEQ